MFGNCYMVDTNHYVGSWKEGEEELHTVCEEHQTIAWAATGVSPSSDVGIVGFSGAMVEQGVCVPVQSEDSTWTGVVDSRGVVDGFAYTVTVSVNGCTLPANCFIKVI